MNYRKKQGGMTFLGWVFVLALLALVSLVAIRLFPLYIEYLGVRASLESLVSQSDLNKMTTREIRRALLQRLDISGIESVSKDNIKVIRGRDASKVVVDYEARTSLLGNVDLIIHFNRVMEDSSH